MEQVHTSSTSWIELDAAALRHNIAQLAIIAGPSRSVGFVVKGNAYGHGLRHIVTLAAESASISTLFVANLHEAIAIRCMGVAKEICALVPADYGLLEQALVHDIQLVCADQLFLARVVDAAARTGVRARLHLKIDTGLSRLGACGCDEVFALATAIKNSQGVELWGVMTHFADAAGADLTFATRQYRSFNEICVHLERAGCSWAMRHAGASGSLDLVQADSLVRVGTLLYGYWKSPAQRTRYQACGWHGELNPVMTWKSRVFHVKRVKAGCSIGYGCDTVATHDMVLAVLPVGYADGYPRALSNRGKVLVKGQLASVTGRVSMNIMTIDVTDIPGVAVGDEVVLLGPQVGVTADDLAVAAGTVNLDILTGISPEIERVVV